jgi:Ni2+-binding GTPase involved in maturation of urease and hydrogenase
VLRINLYGPPGSGKTTLATELFCHLKKEGVNCEIVNELAREWAYQNRPIQSLDQIYLFASSCWPSY